MLNFMELGVRSLANASRARQFNPLNPPGVGWVPLPQTNMAAVVGRARSCVRGRSCVVVRARPRYPTRPPGVGSCAVVRGRARSVVRGRACVICHVWSCAVVRGRSCVVVRVRAWSVVRGRSCVVVRGRSCGRAVLPASRPALPWHERTNEQHLITP